MAVALLLFLTAAGLLNPDSVQRLRWRDGVVKNTTTADRPAATNAVSPAPPVKSCAVPKRSSVFDALNDLFTCLVETHVEPSETFELFGANVSFGRRAGSGAAQPPLLMGRHNHSSRFISGWASHRLFYDLVDLFPPELGQNETRDAAAWAKIEAYLAHLEGSPYVIDTYRTLKSNGAELPDSLAEFVRQTMFDHWFKPYGRKERAHRRGVVDSSGFGHVFVGEVSNRSVSGFHNWLSILAAEESGNFRYQGFINVVTEPLTIAAIQFSWLGRRKELSTFLFGVDTEFQLSVFSACFIVKPGRKTRLRIKGQPVGVQTYYVNHQPESVASAHFVI